jgi:hypothetical protein
VGGLIFGWFSMAKDGRLKDKDNKLIRREHT